MTLTWNLDYYCNLARETRERQKNGQRCRVNKLWCHHNFSDLWLLWSNPEAGFVTNGLYFLKQQPFILNTYLEHSSHTNGLSKGTTFAKKCWFLQKKKEILTLELIKIIFFSYTYVRTLGSWYKIWITSWMLHTITIRLEKCININPIQNGPFWGCSRMGRGQKTLLPSLKSVTNILQSWKLAHLYLS